MRTIILYRKSNASPPHPFLAQFERIWGNNLAHCADTGTTLSTAIMVNSVPDNDKTYDPIDLVYGDVSDSLCLKFTLSYVLQLFT